MPRSVVYSVFLPAMTVLLFAGCAGPIRQYFPDTFYVEDHIYENKPLGFAVIYPPNWKITTDPADMNRAGKKAALQFSREHRELLFMGSTIEGSQGTRGIVDNLNESNDEYLEGIRKANKTSIEKDLGSSDFEGNFVEMKRWDYLFCGMHFAEFLFKTGTYNVRIAFWCEPAMFKKFEPIFDATMNGIELID